MVSLRGLYAYLHVVALASVICSTIRQVQPWVCMPLLLMLWLSQSWDRLRTSDQHRCKTE
jgi:hypothetical protein